jgi:membrane protein required for colicin V production
VNLLDYILAVILGYCLIRGIFRGLVKELAALIGVLGGFYFAFNYYPQMTKTLERWITTAAYAQIVSFLILFFGVYLVVSIAGVIIKYLMNIAWLGWTDRLTGALFGAVKGVLIISVIVAILTTFLPKDTHFLRDSLLVRHTMGISSLLVRIASADMKTLFDTHLKELNQTWQRKTK